MGITEAPHKAANTEASLLRLQEKQGRARGMLRRTVLKQYMHSQDTAMAAKPQHMLIIVTHTRVPIHLEKFRLYCKLQHMSKLPTSRQHSWPPVPEPVLRPLVQVNGCEHAVHEAGRCERILRKRLIHGVVQQQWPAVILLPVVGLVAVMLTCCHAGSAIATQSFAEAPVVRSYPGEQQPASAAQAEAPAPSYTYNMLSAHARNLSLAPALSTALAPASELAYGRLPTYEAASPSAGTYKQQRPHAYALEPVLPPGLEPADTAMQPSQAPSMQNGPDNGHSARAAYAPGPQPSTPPVEAPVGGRLMAQAPAPAPSTAAGLTSGSVLPYAPAAPPAAYAPVQAVSPSGYGAYGYPASLQGTPPGVSLAVGGLTNFQAIPGARCCLALDLARMALLP